MTQLATDNFTRTNQSGFGTASDGNVWSEGGIANQQSISSNAGLYSAHGGRGYSYIGTGTATAVNNLAKVNSANGGDYVGPIIRWDTTNINGYWGVLDNAGNVFIQKFTNGTPSTIGTAAVSGWVQGDKWNLRLIGSGTTISVTAWKDGLGEPGSPQVSVTDSAYSSGRYGAACNLSSTSASIYAITVTDNQSSVQVVTDIASRLRLMSANQLKDVASRFRLKSANQLKDVASRFRLMSASQLKDIASRLRLMSANQLKDVASRFRQRSADQLKDITSRLRLALFKDIASRLRLMSANQLKDIASRFRLISASQLKDIASRLRLMSASQLKDIASRLRLISANQLKDIASRFRLMSANQLKDIASRLRLALFKDIASRLRLMSADQLRNIASRFRLAILKDISTRFMLSGTEQWVVLREPNNPTTDIVILNVLRNVMHFTLEGYPSTYLASIDPGDATANPPLAPHTGLSLTYVQNKYKMALGMTAALPYAIHLSSGKQGYSKQGAGLRTYIGSLVCIIEYCARWDENPASIDAIRRTIAADLERIRANIESNDSLQYNNAAFAVSVPSMTLSPYEGSLNATFPGLILVERTLTVSVEILPYDCVE